ncbi:MAG: TonB-dependent receptor [Steroidobacteraceae bacterium]|jgi:putative OmpL-like beta-barrel porin-2/carboxypeptidase family protein
MKISRYLQGFAISILAIGFLLPAAHADVLPTPDTKESPGTIVGIITNSAKVPVAHATVTARRVDGGAIRSTLSGSDGIYSFADLSPGAWSLTSEVEGFPETALPAVTVAPSKATRSDIVMNGAPPAPSAPATAAFAATSRLTAPTLVAAAPQVIPDALTAPEPGPEVDTETPFAVGDIGWLNGNTREKAPIFDTKFFTPEIRFDMNYLQSQNHPVDHTIVGSTEEFRSGEFQIEQVSFGGDFHWENVKARFLSMLGLFSVTTPRNDASAAVGQWDLQGAYKYFSEANAGYHFDVNHGLNVDMGIFVSYIGLFSYYNFDNWTYQPSFVSSNTPWFFNGLRVQWFPTQTLKIEPWLINGWQSYAKFNSHPGFGGQILWIPNDSLKMVFNSYSVGQDNLASGSGCPSNGGDPNAVVGSSQVNQVTGQCNVPNVHYANVTRVHEDDSILVKYYDAKGQGGAGVSKMAFSVTADLGCEYGGGVNCSHGPNKENFFGIMAYDRTWFHNDLYAVTVGGGFMNNPGRYLALTPPINGATAATGSPYFSQQPGQKLYQWDTQLNFQYMPKDWITWWTEVTYRHSDVPYWSGAGGVTPPSGNALSGVTGPSTSVVCNNGSAIAADNCAGEGGIWYPDLRKSEAVWGAGVMVKF